MIYMVMQKLIQNENRMYENDQIGQEEYELWKTDIQNKLDVFYGMNRLSESQYRNLKEMILEIN